MTVGTSVSRAVRRAAFASLLVLGWSTAAQAQGYISPFAGYNFGGDAGCATVSNCEDKNLNLGIGIGTTGIIGFEEEFAYAKDFFGDIPGTKNSVLTLMSNVMIAPKIGPVRPYALIGAGLIKSKLELTFDDIVATDNNNFGWNVGGGLMLMFGHVGVRGDVRYFHAFQDIEFFDVAISDLKLDFGRASAGLVLQF
jgi:opacity protein-like surface antigen